MLSFLYNPTSHQCVTTGKNIALTRWTFINRLMSLLLNMLSRLVITFLPRSRCLNSWLQPPPAVILFFPQCFHCFYFLFYFFLNFDFYFILLYNTVLVLPYIGLNPPRVYMHSQTWTPLPLPSLLHLYGSSSCTSPKHAVSWIGHRLAIRFLHDSIHVSMPPKIKSVSVSTVSPSICHEVMGPDATILVFWMLTFKPTFSTLFFHFHQEAL